MLALPHPPAALRGGNACRLFFQERSTTGAEDDSAMVPLTGVRVERALDRCEHEAFAAYCARRGAVLRAWRAAPTVGATFAVVAGQVDEGELASLFDCAVHCERPPALYVCAQPRTSEEMARIEAALGGRGAPDGVRIERREDVLLLRIDPERTPFSLVRDLIEIELAPLGASCMFALCSPMDLRTAARIAAGGLGAPISAEDVLEARL